MQIPKSYKLHYPWLPSQDSHSVSCNICLGSCAPERVFTFLINENEFAIMHCPNDDLLYLSPQPGLLYTEALYNHPSYFTGEDDMYGVATNDEKSTAVAKIRIAEITDWLAENGRGSIADKSFLEIGCGYGHTLIQAELNGALKAEGIEFSYAAVDVCKKAGLHVELVNANEPLKNSLSSKRYDVIAVYSLLEHVSDPTEFLKQIRLMITSDGVIVIRVPEMSTAGPWLSLIDHFWHFTRQSLKIIFERSGFEIQEIFPSGTFKGKVHPGKLSSITVIARPILSPKN